ncbi:MFS general substrate transporter [Thozetella sp. PMI_491]|nr:MFS general substrate transporter [Thozetella sp. PMI_491]
MAYEKEYAVQDFDASPGRPASLDIASLRMEELVQEKSSTGAESKEIRPAPSQEGSFNTSELSPPTRVEDQLPPRYSIYSRWQKSLIVLGASLAAFISPLTGQIYLPALNVIASDLHITPSQVNLTITTYMIFQGITPMFFGSFADGAGRRPAYIICFVIYILANIGLALTKNYASLLVVRCIQSAGSASTVALCQAVVADIVSSAERGQYIAITIIPIIFAPSLGPVIGGILSQYLGWRSIFWFLAITGAVLFVGVLLFLPETCREIVGDGSIRPHPFHRTVYQLLKDANAKWKARRHPDRLHPVNSRASTTRLEPLRIPVPNFLGSLQLLLQKEIGLLLVFSSLMFAGFYAIATAMPLQLREAYGMDDLTIGLMYLPTAGGSIFAAFVVGPMVNWNYRRHAAKLGILVDKSRQQDLTNFPIERARLEVGIPLYLLTAVVFLGWGFALQRQAHVAVLCILLFLNGAGQIGKFW